MSSRPDSRIYKHRRCGGQTVISGNDYLRIEFPHRSIMGTFCAACKSFGPLWDFTWMDTGENIAGYRQRLYAAASRWTAVRQGLFGNARSYQPPPLDGVFGDPTHFHWYDPAAVDPPPAPPVQRVHAPADSVPAEVAALGQADHRHHPRPMLAQLNRDPLPFALAVLLVVVMSALLLVLVPMAWVKGISAGFIVLGFVGVVVLYFKDWPAIPSYAAFDSTLVVIDGTTFTIIPWAAMTQFNPTTGALTADGKEFNVSTGVQERRLLVQKIKDRLINRLLPAASESLREGRAIMFGPLTLRRSGIEHQGNELPWIDVRKIDIAEEPSGRSQMWIHRQGGLLPWAKCRFDDVPNYFVMMELIRRNLPPGAPLTGA